MLTVTQASHALALTLAALIVGSASAETPPTPSCHFAGAL
jgi:hypothetical protein